jgi:prepilin-type N-terminal cleavage/methylation domain-containing protein
MKCRGFTLVELLIVVLILGILAAVAVPQFTQSTRDAREAAVGQNCEVLGKAIHHYRLEHDRFPGYPPAAGAPTADWFVKHLTQYSDLAGNTSTTKDPAQWPHGPYLRSGIPVNPLNGSSKVKLIDLDAAGVKAKPLDRMQKAEILALDGAAFDKQYGWLYCPQTGDLIPNDEP